MLEFKCNTALVIAPHPDDEIFGCGGTIARLKANGAAVYVLFLTVGTTRDFSPKGQSTAEERMDEIDAVARCLKFDGYAMAFPGDAYHLKLDAIPQKDLIHAIEKGSEVALERIRPDIVLTTSNNDYNQDHRAVFRATVAATRPASPVQKSFQPAILSYELPYHQHNAIESVPRPTFYVRLSEEHLQAKLEAIRLYSSQLKHPDNPLSVDGIETAARYRGLQCASPAAEAFEIIRFAA